MYGPEPRLGHRYLGSSILHMVWLRAATHLALLKVGQVQGILPTFLQGCQLSPQAAKRWQPCARGCQLDRGFGPSFSLLVACSNVERWWYKWMAGIYIQTSSSGYPKTRPVGLDVGAKRVRAVAFLPMASRPCPHIPEPRQAARPNSSPSPN